MSTLRGASHNSSKVEAICRRGRYEANRSLRPHEPYGAEWVSTYTHACFPEASTAAIRLYAAGCSYWSAAASSASVMPNTVPLTRLSFLPLKVTLA